MARAELTSVMPLDDAAVGGTRTAAEWGTEESTEMAMVTTARPQWIDDYIALHPSLQDPLLEEHDLYPRNMEDLELLEVAMRLCEWLHFGNNFLLGVNYDKLSAEYYSNFDFFDTGYIQWYTIVYWQGRNLSRRQNISAENTVKEREQTIKFWYLPMQYKHYFIMDSSLTIFFIIMGTCGNCLIITSIVTSKTMKNPTNVFLASLAVGDILLVTVSLPVRFMKVWLYQRFDFLRTNCWFAYFVEDFIYSAAAFHMVAISFERFFAVCRPMKVATLCTMSRAKKVVVCLWCAAVVVALPSIFRMESVRITSVSQLCLSRWRSEIGDKVSNVMWVFVIWQIFILFVLPFIIIAVNYGRVISTLIVSLTQAKNMTAGTSKEGETSEDVKSRLRVMKMLVSLVMLFCICWGPSRFVSSLYFSHKRDAIFGSISKEMQIKRLFPTWFQMLTYFNSAFTCLVYAFSSQAWRWEFVRVLTCGRRRPAEKAKTMVTTTSKISVSTVSTMKG